MTGKIFYIASRFDRTEEIREVYKEIQRQGGRILVDWTRHRRIQPYAHNPEMANFFAVEDYLGASTCDVFILLSDPAGKGMYTELGIALASFIQNGKPDIYVVGPYNTENVFYFHSAVKRRETVQDVLREVSVSDNTPLHLPDSRY